MIEVWRAFWFLNRRRPYDNGIPTAIPLRDSLDYLVAFGGDFFYFDITDSEEKVEFLDFVSDMDDAYLNHQYVKMGLKK